MKLVSSDDVVCCDQRLSEAQTTVACWNLGMSENFKPLGVQRANQLFEKKQIIERAAAQTDLIEREFLTQQAREAYESFHQSVVESTADCVRANLRAEILDNGLE